MEKLMADEDAKPEEKSKVSTPNPNNFSKRNGWKVKLSLMDFQ